MHEAIAVSARQVLWQTLAQAFLPPMGTGVAAAFASVLPDDLAELSVELALDADADVEAFRRHARELADPTALLWEYSRLFLPPAGITTLNLSRFVDTGVSGPCMDALELAYRSHGLEPTDGLHDFADHAARQMECLAYLEAAGNDSAAEFANLCLVGALPRLAARLAQAAPGSPYTALARIAAGAVQAYRAAQPRVIADKPNRRHDTAAGVWRHCGGCGKPYAREKELRIMAMALARAHLPSDHLDRCPSCRDRAQGFFRREIA